ncbi:MAG TPA: c-type cytochrome, partial [Devosia sp.]|nr:c-type cytochrome [Devosia sp.]
FLADALYHPTAVGPVYALPEPEGGGEDEGGGEEAPAVSIGTLLASADATQGAEQANKCGACHDMSEANTNKTGPGLYDVVERVIGSHPGFAYSAIMQEHQAAGDTWTYDHLNAFLLSPKAHMPGTKMTFAGVKNDQERANIIAFLSTLSASPKPFPPPDAAEPEVAEGEEAEGSTSEEPVPSNEMPQVSTEEGVSSVQTDETVSNLEGIDTGESESPGGALEETPVGGGEQTVPDPSAPPSAVSSEPLPSAEELSAPSEPSSAPAPTEMSSAAEPSSAAQ